MSLLAELSSSAQAVLARVGPAVVTIGRDGRGSGVVIAPGKVLTNAHNLRDRTTSVTFADGSTAQATMAGADADGDLVVLDVLDVETGAVAPATWASRAPEPGDVVFALSRGGHRSRISFGMVTSTDFEFQGPRGRQVQGGVEHTAVLARGSSGGPLTDAEGNVVGLNTHRIGRGFYVARPVDASLQATIEQLASGTSIIRPRLGVALVAPAVAAKLRAAVGLPERTGLLVRGVEPESPAARAGIVDGDLLVAVGDAPLTSLDDLYDALAGATEAVTLSVVRGTEERSVVVSFAEAPASS